jgi:protein-disulfide isomerase
MRIWTRFVAALFAFVLATAPAAARDWSQTVTQTRAGAFVMGNPKAKVRLVEYLSMTCSHCAHFAGEAFAPLRAGYISAGLVSLEIRHAVRDPFDLAATMLVRCGGVAGYFPATEAVLARQPVWMEAASAFQQQHGDLEERSSTDRLIAYAEGSGLSDLVVARGLPKARVPACIGNEAEQKRVATMVAEAWDKRKIGGTPAFLINGVLQNGVFDWAALEPKLKAALK